MVSVVSQRKRHTMGWFSNRTPAIQITEQTQLGICKYLMEYSQSLNGSGNRQIERVSYEALRASNELLININKTGSAIQILKKIRQVQKRMLAESRKSNEIGELVGEIFLLEVMLKDLGVTNFDV